MLDLLIEPYSLVFIAFNLFYGLSSFLSVWDGFVPKFINVIYILSFITFILIVFVTEDFDAIGVAITGVVACWVGHGISEEIDDDFHGIFLIVSVVAWIAMFILMGIYI